MVPYLPPEIMFNILLRVPARTIVICKCVCKSWLDLLVTPEFVTSHYSNSAPGLATFEHETHSKPYKIIEFVNEVDLNSHEPRWNVVFGFDLPFDESLYTSANGLLFHKTHHGPGDFFISNPITREYITLPYPQRPCWREAYGFGVSTMSGQYKVVRIFDDKSCRSGRFECQVYTVGTGSWRRITFDDQFIVSTIMAGAFLNGNIHWLACKGSSSRVLCLDLETESFSTFSPPPTPSNDLHSYGNHYRKNLYVLGDCLSVSDNFEDWRSNCRVDIWLMKEYGEEKSWTKEFVIRKFVLCENLISLCPIKVFKDGDILMALRGYNNLLYFSRRTKTLSHVHLFVPKSGFCIRTTIYTPSFLPLKTYVLENVTSL